MTKTFFLPHNELHKSLGFIQKQPLECKKSFSKKEAPTLVFYCEICQIFKNIYFEEYLRNPASISSTSKYYSK